MGFRTLIFTFLFALFFAGCSFTQGTIQTKKVVRKPLTVQPTNHLSRVFMSQYKEWRGVKYKYGGNSKKGIDCSAFIQRTFKSKLNIKIPRTTWYQAKVGKQVPKAKAKTGDLVFFRTGRKSRHVGIYLEDGKFLHVSQKKGVIISTLDNVYFKKHFWKVKRVIKED